MKVVASCLLPLLLACHSAAEYQEKQLFVIVGESMGSAECPKAHDSGEISFDSCARAKFKVLENYYGHLNTKVVSFTAFSHYGVPEFPKGLVGLLYLTYEGGQFYQCKYLFTPLYKAKDGRWASTYNVTDYEHPYNKGIALGPVPIEFANEVEFDLSNLPPDVIAHVFPEPYYQIHNGKAIAKYGNYIDELFFLKKNGVLKARGYF